MKTAQEFMNDANKIANTINEIENTITKAELIQHQKYLGLLKKSVVESKKISNAQYDIQKTKFNPGCSSLFMGKRAIASARSRYVQDVQHKKLQASNLYDQVIRVIDSYTYQIDEIKAKK